MLYIVEVHVAKHVNTILDVWHGEDIRIHDHTSEVGGHEFQCLHRANCSCDCACNLCDILSGTYKFCNLYMYLNATQFPVGFFSFKKPYLNQPRVQTTRNQYR